MEAEGTFASIDDYEARYGPVSDRGRLSEALADATRLIAAECSRSGVDASDPALAGALMQACRSAAARAMQAEATDAPLGVTQFSQGAIGITESWSMANPHAEVYLTRAERRLLGLSRGRASFARAMIGGCREGC